MLRLFWGVLFFLLGFLMLSWLPLWACPHGPQSPADCLFCKKGFKELCPHGFVLPGAYSTPSPKCPTCNPPINQKKKKNRLDQIEEAQSAADKGGSAAIGSKCPIHPSAYVPSCRTCNPKGLNQGNAKAPSTTGSPKSQSSRQPSNTRKEGYLSNRQGKVPSRDSSLPEREYTPEEKKNLLQAAGVMGGLGLLLGLAWWFGSGKPKVGGSSIGESEKNSVFSGDAASSSPVSVEERIDGVPTESSQVGDTRFDVDESGHKWEMVYDGSRWIDRDSYTEKQRTAAENETFQNQQAENLRTHNTEFDRNLEQRRENLKDDLREIHDRNVKEHRDFVEVIQEINQSDKARADNATQTWEARVKFAENMKAGVESVALPLIGAATGGIGGFAVQTAYTFGSEIVGGATEGIVGSSSLQEAVTEGLKGAGIGALKGGVNFLVGEGMNAAGAVVSKGVRSVLHSIPLRTSGTIVPPSPIFNESLPVTDLKKVWGNLKSGNPLMRGVDQGMSKVSISRVFDVLTGSETPSRGAFRTETAFRKAMENFNLLKSSARNNPVRGQLIDSKIGNFVNDEIFGGRD
ncbi:hypothetical protein HYY75_04965 [bacterium]|nr:hypothetical protein [bacterium]